MPDYVVHMSDILDHRFVACVKKLIKVLTCNIKKNLLVVVIILLTKLTQFNPAIQTNYEEIKQVPLKFVIGTRILISSRIMTNVVICRQVLRAMQGIWLVCYSDRKFRTWAWFLGRPMCYYFFSSGISQQQPFFFMGTRKIKNPARSLNCTVAICYFGPVDGHSPPPISWDFNLREPGEIQRDDVLFCVQVP